jgi:hypothetical protein
MVRWRLAQLLAASLLAAGGLAVEDAASQPATEPPIIYKWVDQNGIAHYTTDYDRIPRSLRRGARRLDRSPATSAAPAPPPPRSRAGRSATHSEAERWARTDRPADWDDDGWGEPEAWDEGGPGGAPATERAAGRSYAEVEARLREIDAEIAALEQDIAADEEVLKRFVAAPAPQRPSEVAYDGSFREVAQRLPRMLTELQTLQDERAELETR